MLFKPVLNGSEIALKYIDLSYHVISKIEFRGQSDWGQSDQRQSDWGTK
jgi:hypothetical protein